MANCVIAYNPCFSCDEKKCEICELDMHRKRVFQQSEGEGYQSSGIDAIKDMPAADVAPKSDVARVIFEEMQKIIVHNTLHNENYSFEGVMDSITKDLDELKKKYTQEK